MASPLVADLKSASLQTHLNIALKKLVESDKYQILKVSDQESSRIDHESEEFDRFTLTYTILDSTFKCNFFIYINWFYIIVFFLFYFYFLFFIFYFLFLLLLFNFIYIYI